MQMLRVERGRARRWFGVATEEASQVMRFNETTESRNRRNRNRPTTIDTGRNDADEPTGAMDPAIARIEMRYKSP
ncbi:hypothetical protein RB213_000597 [Colletotrichum asianum]